MHVATLSEMLEELVHRGRTDGDSAQAHELRGELEGRIAAVRAAVSGAAQPRVIALQRLDPPRVAGFWVPEMISIAGGEDVAGPPGLEPPEVGWGALSGLRAEIVILMLGGESADARAQAMEHWERIESLRPRQVLAVDAEPAFTEPGPGLIDGVELLAHLLHPERIDSPGNIGFAQLEAP
jgi:iron complex transport system substrate-binding protein